MTVNRRTIERWFDSWSENSIDSLPIQPGRGGKTRLKGFETVITKQLKDHSRNFKNVINKPTRYLMESHFREIFIFKRQVSCSSVENTLFKRYENLRFSNFPLESRGKPRGILMIKR